MLALTKAIKRNPKISTTDFKKIMEFVQTKESIVISTHLEVRTTRGQKIVADDTTWYLENIGIKSMFLAMA